MAHRALGGADSDDPKEAKNASPVVWRSENYFRHLYLGGVQIQEW